MPAMPVRTVRAALSRLDTDFSAFAYSFNRGEYALWLGSGISRDRVPNVGKLLERVLEHLRSKVDPHSPDCEYLDALNEVLRLSNLSSAERDSIDLSVGVKEWVLRERIVSSLVRNYSKVLDVPVGDSGPDDYLVWTALNVADTYGDPGLEPDVEHYGLAVIALEGLTPSIVTANWDGLLEKALNELTPSYNSRVKVAVRTQDLRGTAPISLIKFHGCAVLARQDQSSYRELLIARESQISGWTAQQGHSLMRNHLELLYSENPTLMIGLSAQDANLHTVFATAINHLEYQWPATPPALVLSEEKLEAHHRNVLSLTYASNYSNHRAAINDSALLGSFAKTTILALLLAAITEKTDWLIEETLGDMWESTEISSLRGDLQHLRNVVADLANPTSVSPDDIVAHQRDFVRQLIDSVNFALSSFRSGQLLQTSDLRYEPLSSGPIHSSALNADFPSAQYGRLGVALSLVGRGMARGQWLALPGSSTNVKQGAARLSAKGRSTRLFFVRDAATLMRMQLDPMFDEDEASTLVVVADKEPLGFTRSPRAKYGRSGAAARGRFNVETALAETSSADDLFEAFELAGGF